MRKNKTTTGIYIFEIVSRLIAPDMVAPYAWPDGVLGIEAG